MNIQLKRAYEAPVKSDGQRVLVDRLWPRGVQSERRIGCLVERRENVELRKWFGHDPDKWTEFKQRYRKELKDNPAWDELVALAKKGTLTLVYAAKDSAHNEAVVLKSLLEHRGS